MSATLKSWLGAGGRPVESALSQTRADTCLKKREDGFEHCPNLQGGWKLADEVAKAIKLTLELKNQMKIRVNGEQELKNKHCSICSCYAALKVHCGIEHIEPNLMAGEYEQFPNFCWQKTEIDEFRKPK